MRPINNIEKIIKCYDLILKCIPAVVAIHWKNFKILIATKQKCGLVVILKIIIWSLYTGILVIFGLQLALWLLQSCRFLGAKCWNFDLMRLLQKLLLPTYFAVTIKYCADP